MTVVACGLAWMSGHSGAQKAPALSAETRRFVSIDATVVALTHVRLIDGTGDAAKSDQTIVVKDGLIQSTGAAGSIQIPTGAKVLDLSGKSVIPGLVMMHEHMFYPTGKLVLFNEMGFSFPRLYLASGVTSLRTTGSVIFPSLKITDTGS